MKFPDVSELGAVDIEAAGRFRIYMVKDGAEFHTLLRNLVSTVGDYMWEVSARDEKGRCRRCDAPEGQGHIGTCVVMRLNRAHLAAADLLWWLDHPNAVTDPVTSEDRHRAERLRNDLRARGEWR